MPTAIVDEKIDCRRGKHGQTYVFTYNVWNVDDADEAVAAVLAEVPESFGGLFYSPPDFQEVGPEHYEVTIEYGKLDDQSSQPTGSITRDFQIGVESAHITASRQTIASYAIPGHTAPNTRQLIGVQDDGTLAGVDVQIPTSQFGYTIRPENSAVTQAYEVLAGDLVGKTNLTTFLGRDPGTVLFLGCSGSERNPKDSELRLEFAYRRNETDIAIGDIEGIAKDGWDYLWVISERDEQDIGGGKKVFVQTPVAVYVEEVFPRADLNVLVI